MVNSEHKGDDSEKAKKIATTNLLMELCCRKLNDAQKEHLAFFLAQQTDHDMTIETYLKKEWFYQNYDKISLMEIKMLLKK